MKPLKLKFSCLIAPAKFQSAMGAFHHPNLVGNYQISYSNIFALTHPVNGILLVRSAQRVGHESYCRDLGGFDVSSSF